VQCLPNNFEIRQASEEEKIMKIHPKRFLKFTTAALAITAAQYCMAADTFVFDPDAAGPSSKIGNVNTFQFGAGNSLFKGAIPFTQSATFQLLFHAQLNSLVNNAGVQIIPAGLNSSYEITLVGSVTETVTNVNTDAPPRVAFRMTGTQATNSFIEIYFDAGQNANPLQGTGYNDGTLILRGTPNPPSSDGGTFTLTNPQPATSPAFDSFATNDYPGITSVTGIGATKMEIVVTAVDSGFFVSPAQGDAGREVHIGDILSLDFSQAVPFDKIDPSKKFAAVANTGTSSGPTPAATPRIGTNNGTIGPDIQLQTLLAGSIRAGSSSPTPTPTASPTPSGTPTPTPSATPTPSTTPTPTPAGRRVIVSASPAQVTEGQDSTITFSVRPAGTTHSALTVNYSVGGNATLNTDYTLSGTPGQVPIPATSDTATVTLHSLTDTVKEPNGEAAKIFVAPGTGYDVPTQIDAKRATVIIVDPGT
jgi:hypothetical protein